jgi:hypothetical protein
MELIKRCSTESLSNIGYISQAFGIKLNLTNLTYCSMSHCKVSSRPANQKFSHLQWDSLIHYGVQKAHLLTLS